MTSKMLLNILSKAIEMYNRYRTPEARCLLENIDNDKVVMRFEGHFCVTCGVIDWIEDFIYILKDLGVEAVIAKVEYHTDENFVLVEINIKSFTPD